MMLEAYVKGEHMDSNSPRSVLVTGGGTGIGAAVARHFAAGGDVVHIAARNEGRCQNIASEITAAGGKAFAHALDITDSAQVEDVVQRIEEVHGSLDVLVANAGMAASAPVEETSDELLNQILEVNVTGTFACCRAAYARMKGQGRGAIITIGSVVSHKGYANQSAYGASKHAIRGFTKALCVEAQEFGVRVACVMPGGVATEMVQATRPDLDLSQIILPEDIAEAVAYLVNLPARLAIDELCLRRWAASPQ